ncbi:hypothetical protein [Fusibacter sp. 3D3]|uniref:hypothetical protein n=1 Tax=Fusibacter sp. 3D3 TaxID=1048380 RepID=UPI0008560B90|nr:hypothetical protein [Fusibacter sp. 3D3]GAU78919.1 hypothetical protein F3D3_3555 [Fusibacter sp. 3D3]
MIIILTISGCTSKPLSSQFNKGIELLFFDDLKNEKIISIPIQLDTITDEVYLFNKDELVYTLTPSTYRYDGKAKKIILTIDSYIEHFNRIKIGLQYYDLDDYYLEKMSDVKMRRDLVNVGTVTLDAFNSEVREQSSDEYYVISEDDDYEYTIVFPFSEFNYLTSDLSVTTNETGKKIHHHFELDDSFLQESGIKSITFESALVKKSLDSDELEVIMMLYQPFLLE